MTAAAYALVSDTGRIGNVALIDPDTAGGKAYMEWVQGQYARVLDVVTFDRPPQIGQYVDADGRLVPLPTLTADPVSIPADGTTTSTVTYSNVQPDAPASVVLTVNGVDSDPVQLAGGVAELDVDAADPGTVTITCAGLTTTVEAT